jgi:hypothetical protein
VKLISKNAASIAGTDLDEPCTKGGRGGGGLITARNVIIEQHKY